MNLDHGRSAQQPSLRLPTGPALSGPHLITGNAGASLVDLGDGVACLVFHTKMNTINADITAMLDISLTRVAQEFAALVIANDAPHFSAGADIRDFLAAIRAARWDEIDRMETQFQGLMQRLKQAPFPTVACPKGMTFGAGCEMSLHTSARVVAASTIAGLVETKVGLFPAGGGTKELALRAYDAAAQSDHTDPTAFLQSVFKLIATAQTSASGAEAVAMGLYPADSTQIVGQDGEQVSLAKQAALAMLPDFVARTPRAAIPVLGNPGIQSFKRGLAQQVEAGLCSDHDARIGTMIATVLCGGDVAAGTLVSEQALLDSERRLFVALSQEPKTLERIEHMLLRRQPLRN